MRLDRRTFVIGAVSAAAMPWAGRVLIPRASADTQNLLFDADMEVDSFSVYGATGTPSITTLKPSGNSPTISTDFARLGTKSLRIYLNRSSSTTKDRTEVTCKGDALEFRKTYWIGFSIYVPSDWQSGSTSADCLFQTHNRPVDYSHDIGFSVSPILELRIPGNDDRWRWRQWYVQTNVDDGTAVKSDLKMAFERFLSPVARGQWTDWVIEHRFDWRSIDDGGIGVTRVWQNGTKVVDYVGPNCCNATNAPYIKFGLYKSVWKYDNYDPVSERTYYFDEFRVSRPDAGSFNLVSPDREDGRAPPEAPKVISVE